MCTRGRCTPKDHNQWSFIIRVCARKGLPEASAALSSSFYSSLISYVLQRTPWTRHNCNGVHLQENAPFFRFEANSKVTHVKSDRCCPYNALSTSCTKMFARNRAKEYHDKCIIVQDVYHPSVTCARYRSKFLHQNCSELFSPKCDMCPISGKFLSTNCSEHFSH